jgi:hypothetical protein
MKNAPPPDVQRFKTRIVGHDLVAPEKLVANPLNWRLHPDTQKKVMRSTLTELGWVQSVIVNKRTGRMIDGHMRVELAVEEKEKFVPVVYVDLSEEEERAVLASLDPLGDMATTNEQVLRKILEDTETVDVESLFPAIAKEKEAETYSDAELDPAALAEEVDETITEAPIAEFSEHAVFSSSNEWGIPDLLDDMFSDAWPEEVYAGIAPPKDAKKCLFLDDRLPGDYAVSDGGILCYYVWDKHFEDIWRDAVASVQHHVDRNFGAVVMPDFSLWRDDPFASQLWNVYRSRWMARYWQEAGLKVIPNLQTGTPSVYPWAIHTLPKKCPVLAVQCRGTSDDLGKKLFLACVREAVKVVRPERMFIYGGIENKHWLEGNLPKGPQYGWLSSVANLRNRMLKEKRTKTGSKKRKAR